MSLPSGRALRVCWGLAVACLATSAFLPGAWLVEMLGRRFNTAKAFAGEVEAGFIFLRVGLALNGLILSALPFLLRRFEYARDLRPECGRPDRVAAAALYGVTLLVALPGLFEGWQLDEWRNMDEYLRFGVGVTLTRTVEGDNHVLYNVLAAPTTALLGPGTLSSRLPALLLSPLAVPLLFLRLRTAHPPGRSFMACLPAAGFPLLLQYAHEGRAYGPLIATLVALLVLRDDALHGSRRSWVLFVLLGIAAVWFHLYAAVSVFALCAGALVVPENRRGSPLARNASSLFLVAGVSWLLYSPHLPHYFSYLGSSHGPSFHPGIPRLGEILAGPSRALPVDLFILPWLLCFALGARKARDAEIVTPVIAAVLLWIMIARAGSGHFIRYYTPAIALGLLPASAAVASFWSRRRWIGACLWVAFAGSTVGGVVQYYRLGRLDYRGAAEELRGKLGPGERVAGIYDGRPLAAYLDHPVEILGEREVVETRPDWFVVIDHHLGYSALLSEWVPRHYDPAFRKPSIRGTFLAFRRKPLRD